MERVTHPALTLKKATTKFPCGIINQSLTRFEFYGVQECNKPLMMSLGLRILFEHHTPQAWFRPMWSFTTDNSTT